MEPFEIMISESQERMLCVVEPARRRRGARRLRALGGQRDRDRRGHRHAAACGCSTASALVGDLPVVALVDECPAYDLEPRRAGVAALPGAAARRSPTTRTPARRCSRCSGSANLASRRWAFEQYDCVVGSRTVAPARAGRRGGAPIRLEPDATAARPAIAVVDRRQRPPRRGRSLPRRGRGGRRVLGQPRLRRRRAARADELPELRQPGEAAHRVAAHARDRRPRRRLPRARRPGRGRQRLALQRGRRRADLPDAGRRHGRRAARRRARPAGSASRRRATRSR